MKDRMFFFEKKNQKTFNPCRTLPASPRQHSQKFFASFFQKRRLFSASAMCLGLLAAHPAHADEQTVKLIELLIKKGILTQGQAGELLKETATPHGRRAHAPAPPVEAEAAPEPPKKGEIRVTYVPQFVRKQIADQVRAQVMTEAQSEGWAAPDALPEWTKRVRVYGDIRARYEADLFDKGNYNQFINFASVNAGSPFDIASYQSGNVASPPFLDTTQDRNRFRLRARFGVEAQLADTVAANIRIGTGDPNGPVATNATLGENGAFSQYSIFLDRAYIAFQPDVNVLIQAGRTPNPFDTTDILFYKELAFDGASARYQHGIGSAANAYITAGAFPLFNTDFAFSTDDPNKFASTDAYLFAGQIGATWQVRADQAAALNVAFFDFTGVQGAVSSACTEQQGAAYYCNTDDTRYMNGQFGNTLYEIRNIVPNGANPINPQYFGLASRFAVLEVHPKYTISTYAPVDIELEGDFIDNLAFDRAAIIDHGAPSSPPGPVNNLGSTPKGYGTGPYSGGNTGYMAKITVGYPVIKHLWDWQAYAAYKYIASDATIDALDDAEFHLGGTNARGYVLGAALGVADRTSVSLRWLSSEVVSGPPDGNDVLLLDLNASF